MPDVTKEIKALKERIKFLEGIVLEGKTYTPGEAERERAIQAFRAGDSKPLAVFISRGGKPPEYESASSGGFTRKSQ